METVVEIAEVETSRTERLPLRSPIAAYLETLHARYAALAEGKVATYITELAKASPDWFGICLVTADGAVYEAGDTDQRFTIQSISKPLTYGLILEDHGEEAVRRRIGIEPTGEAFNSVSLDPETGAPLNAMINAGAIAGVSMVAERTGLAPIDRILAAFSRYAGRPLSIDDAVYRSETETGHRNRAIGHLLRNAGVIEDDPEQALQCYFQQCAALVDCRDLGMIAATLANGGLNPVTGERAAKRETVRRLLSVMTTCGMYDFAGEWLYTVGIPAKSGVSGGIMAVLPGQLGIGVFSPPLDSRGNSIRGVRVCQDVSRDLDVHLVQPAGRPASPVRDTHTLAERSSKRTRTERERAVLRTDGQRATAFELQGEISFPAAESVIRAILESSASVDFVVIDFRRVARVDRSAIPILVDLAQGLIERGGWLALSGVQRHARLSESMRETLGVEGSLSFATFAELDLALEWCEAELIRAAGCTVEPPEVPLRAHELVDGLTPDQLSTVEEVLQKRRFAKGEQVVRAGDPAEEMFLISEGQLSVTLALGNGERKRLATAAAGMVLGELAIVGQRTRSADVWADTGVECYVLTAVDLDRLRLSDPTLAYALLANLLRMTSQLARRTNEELALLAG